MSLNGLDAPVLTEAFGKACAEPGSWYVTRQYLFASFRQRTGMPSGAFADGECDGRFRFWIKYVSRDDVELLCQGTNGTEEMREAAAREPEDSPLYGFIRFRRRNILVKYVPEDTSRVLKGKLQLPSAWYLRE